MSLNYHVKVTAVGEVRDKDGNLISSTPVEHTETLTADEAAARGIEIPQKENQS